MKHILFFVVFIFLGLQSCHKETNNPLVLEYGTVNDIDGNSYKTVKIGDQWWMCENLRVKHFQDGANITFIGNVDQDSLWAQATESSYSYINDSLFGCFYNHLVVQDS
ncbi:MAG: hypothetical protein ORN53_05485, partial [Crocinitomicaceae bacterium]|nr:hypothetical protein [Crocinitomicaceae bacterium]